jgi:hypothetical protein
MISLREVTKRRILATLEKSHFTASGYDIKYSTTESNFLHITFLPNKKLYFAATDQYGGFRSEESPGVLQTDEETFKHASLEDCLKAIAPWATRILEEYRALNPIVDEFETLKKSIAEQIEQHAADETAHFSREEAEAIRTKLDELGAKLAELSDKSATQEHQLREANAEIKSLKTDLELFPRGVWLRMAGGKVINLVKKVATSKEGRELAFTAAKKLLQLDGPK